MKVAHYSTYLSRSAGGLFYSVSGLAKAEAAAGMDVVIVGGADHFYEQDRFEWGDVPLRPYKISSGSYALSASPVKELSKFRPDLVHFHGIWTAASVYARASTILGIPTVLSPRGMLDPWILARKRSVKQVHAALFERPALRKAHIHALSQSEYDSVIGFASHAASRTFIVPNGIGEAAYGDAAERSGVLYIGRLHAKKRVLELARLWRTSDQLSTTTLTIAGWGDGAYEAELRSVVDGARNIRFVGPLYGEAKSDALNSAQFFILPSLSEGLPMAVLEALQHGTVPIITDQCNLPELFEAGVAVRLEADLSDLEKTVKAAVQLPQGDIAKIADSGRTYSRRYLWSTIAQKMCTHYESILEQGST